jgi:uncharacterized protein YjdB
MVRFTLRLGGAAALVALAACAERSPTAVPADDPAGSARGGYLTTEFRCSVTVASRQTSCVEARAAGVRGDLIMGSGYVQLNSRNVSYDGVQNFTFQVAATNLIHQKIGTTDGSTVASTGIRVFFALEPYATSGSGTITVVPDGYDAFTASNQPYYEYDQILDNNVQSSWKGWLFQMPPTVTTFAFTVYVSAPVQFPVGWITVNPDSWSVDVGFTKQLSATDFNQYGNLVSSPSLSWSTGNTSIATVSSSGLVTATGHGNVTITVSDNAVSGRTGTALINVP